MKLVHAAACILVNTSGEILIAQRPKHKQIMPDYWEFPGGELEEGETPEGALCREIEEELGVTIQDNQPFTFISETRKDYHVIVYLYLCHAWNGEVKGKEDQAIAWVRPDALSQWKLLPANIPLIPLLITRLSDT